MNENNFKIYELLADIQNLLIDYEWSDIGGDLRFKRYMQKINKTMDSIEADTND